MKKYLKILEDFIKLILLFPYLYNLKKNLLYIKEENNLLKNDLQDIKNFKNDLHSDNQTIIKQTKEIQNFLSVIHSLDELKPKENSFLRKMQIDVYQMLKGIS